MDSYSWIYNNDNFNNTNNICIFYFSCSQQESLEKVHPDWQNGMYCAQLLRRLGENKRVENILMDVATGRQGDILFSRAEQEKFYR
jgi:hypothetical protein